MKILFIGQQDFKQKNGGAIVSKNNCEALEKNNYLVEKEFLVNKITIFSKIYKLINLIVLKNFFSYTKEKKILEKIKKNNYEALYFDTSLAGSLIKKIKNENSKIKIIAFFHNIEYNYFLQKKKVENKGIKSRINMVFLRAAKYQEKKTIENSDCLILLSERERREILKIYGEIDTKKIEILPIALSDCFKNKPVKYKNEKKILFIGSYFFPNIEGIKWFCKEVMPYINYKLEIIGKGMEVLKDELEKYSNKIEVIGEVEKIDNYYLSSDIVIAPIFSGSGMKTKTIEALMFGKYIIGTDEAFQGIEIDEKIGIICNTKSEFIEALNKNWNLKSEIIRKESRELFLKEFSLEVRMKKMKKILEK